VFYVQASGGTFDCGATLSQNCKYLEAAPTTGSNAWTDVIRSWATDVNSNETTAVFGADGTAIGTGYQNTLDIVAQTGNVAATSAAVEAREYRGPNNHSDWFLPSKLELNQLCRYAWNLSVSPGTETCTGMSGTILTGFSSNSYWSSSEYDASYAWRQNFAYGNQSFSFLKINAVPYVRPVRAFTTIGEATCAQGGSCTVGVDTGPGGGIVFYYSATPFTSTGSDCDDNCHYLEAAPSDQSSGIVWATGAAVCYDNGSTSSNNSCELNSIYSGDSSAQAASRTAAIEIGMGMANTNQIHARLTTVGLAATSTYAAGKAWAYSNNSKTDWFLPSKLELNELYTYITQVGGFSTDWYWSSSEYNATLAHDKSFSDGGQSGFSKTGTDSMRPVRAF
jgi:Protein of unknown function (DUF1566)